MSHPTPGRLRRVLPFALIALAVLSDPALAQTATEVVAKCIDKAADAFVGCVLDEPWYTEALCHVKYAADSILCVPSTLLRLVNL
jgi:hypothetical protein